MSWTVKRLAENTDCPLCRGPCRVRALAPPNWAVVDDNENVIASGFEDEATALVHISFLGHDNGHRQTSDG